MHNLGFSEYLLPRLQPRLITSDKNETNINHIGRKQGEAK